MGDFIKVEQDGYVALVTIDNPPVNALSARLLQELGEELTQLDGEDGTRAIILRGAGEKAFVAGADIKEFPSLRDIESDGGSARGIQAVGLAVEEMRTPVLVAIHGFCLGGGLELAMACDIRVAAEDAQIGQPEIKLGLIPGGGGTQRLPRFVGPGRALLMNMGGEPISGQQAYNWGLVERVTPPGGHVEGALEIARVLAERSPFAVAIVKELARETRDLPLREGLKQEAEGFMRCIGSDDGMEGISAFIEKRQPQWTESSPLKAIQLTEVGGPEQLKVVAIPPPEPEDGQVVVRVRAAGINFLDVLVRQGQYPQPPPLPTVPGIEVAGEVDGRRVMALSRHGGGGYAEWLAVEEDWLVPLPDEASFEEGASFLMTFLTAWIPLRLQVRIEPGMTVLVHAAAGGVGSAAVQAAKHLGARVVATASTEMKRTLAHELGADETFGYDDFAQNVKADVVIDPVGGPVFEASLKALNPLGTIVAIGYAAGMWNDVSPALLVGRNVGVQGFYLGRLMNHRPELVREAIGELVGLWEQGAFRPIVGAAFPLEEAAEAHRLIEDRKHHGKVVLIP